MPQANLTAQLLGLGGATADATNRLSVNTPNVLLNNAGASIDMTVNKNAASNDASFSFKTGFSVRALFDTLGTNPYWARNRLLLGQESKPVTGAVLIFERGSGGHVGFAIGQDDTNFFVLGGNQSDAVTIARIAKSRLLGARWPASYPPRFQRLPTMKPGEFLTTNDEI